MTILVFTDLGPAGRRLEQIAGNLEQAGHGDVRFALRVLGGGASTLAAESLFAAHTKGRFFELQEALGTDLAAVDQTRLDEALRSAGLAATAIREVLQTGKPRRRADADMRLAATYGVRAPTCFINGERVDGRSSEEQIMRTVARQRARAEALLATGVDRVLLYAELTRSGRAGAGRTDGPTATRRREDPEAVYRVEIEGAPVRGPANALVTIVELGDFQCPFCLAALPALRDILERHPQDVRLVWKNSPLSSHPQGSAAAAAAMAAHAQGRFWPMHDALFAAQRELGPETYERIARELRLDLERFRAELAGGRHLTAVSLEAAAAGQFGAIGTPVFFVNGKRLRGFRSADQLVALVDRELDRARAMVRDEHVPRVELFERITTEGARQPMFLQVPDAAPTPDGERRSTVQDLLPSRTGLPAPRQAPAAPLTP